MKATHFYSLVAAAMLTATAALTGCGEVGDGDELFGAGLDGDVAMTGETSGDDGGDHDGDGGNTQAGIVTAGEWCDLDHWPFWSGLVQGEALFADKSSYWGFFTNNRVPVTVTDADGKAVAGVSVKLLRGEKNPTEVWEAVTDNHGQADCWVGLFQSEKADASKLSVSIDGVTMPGHPTVCYWDSLAQTPTPRNTYVVSTPTAATSDADIAFVVDATGSMGDEIRFLKSDMVDIINKVKASQSTVAVRTAALFYRDEGDEYLTRPSAFSSDLSVTANFVEKQEAGGGGDYPEAVHTALADMLQKLDWNTHARARIAFLILDAPAHHETKVIASLQESVKRCAQMGIRLIPVAASGVDKNTEFMLRFFAITTGGTYVFLTDDSGVGNAHIAATVGPYEVEPLNSLLIRLIEKYTE